MPSTDLHPPFDAYKGNDPYIFVSYAHKDSATVFPELEEMRMNGYRLWYDEGIDPGNEWPDEIALALSRATLFLVFVTPNAVESHNVKNEINFAINRRKQFLAVYLVETELPMGLELRMGDIQAVMKYRMPPESYARKIEKALPETLKGQPTTTTTKVDRTPPVRASGQGLGALPELAAFGQAPAVDLAQQEAERLQKQARMKAGAKMQLAKKEFRALWDQLVQQDKSKAYYEARRTIEDLLRLEPDNARVIQARDLVFEKIKLRDAEKRKEREEREQKEEYVRKARADGIARMEAAEREKKAIALKPVRVRLMEQLDEQAFGKAQKSVSSLLNHDPQDRQALEAQAMIIKRLSKTIQIPDTSVSIGMVYVPPGSFTMGSSESERDRKADEGQHEVQLTDGCLLSKRLVSQELWERVMGNHPSKFKSKNMSKHPVDSVSWDDCQEFLERLKARNCRFRLPTEAEWEFACRAGSSTAFCFGDEEANLADFAWYTMNSGEETQPVGQKAANNWGIFDMHGNVWEWCQDRYGKYPTEPTRNPKDPASGKTRVLRGGGWSTQSSGCRSANRDYSTPGRQSSAYGFRLVRDLD